MLLSHKKKKIIAVTSLSNMLRMQPKLISTL